MALSEKIKQRIRSAITNKEDADSLISTIEAGGNPVAAFIAPLGATSNLSALAVTATDIPASNFTAANAAEPTKAEIDAGIDVVVGNIETALNLKADNADCETLRTQVEARLDAAEAKIDAILAGQVSSGQMAAS